MNREGEREEKIVRYIQDTYDRMTRRLLTGGERDSEGGEIVRVGWESE